MSGQPIFNYIYRISRVKGFWLGGFDEDIYGGSSVRGQTRYIAPQMNPRSPQQLSWRLGVEADCHDSQDITCNPNVIPLVTCDLSEYGCILQSLIGFD